jgi:hypothetical protein
VKSTRRGTGRHTITVNTGRGILAKDEKVEFTRDNKGRITSAKIKDV